MQVILLEVNLKAQSTIVRFTSCPFDIEYNGALFQAAGDMLSISDLDDTYEISTNGITVSLSGISSIQNIINLDAFLNAPIDILLAEVPDGQNIASAATYFHRGYCDTPVQKVDLESGLIQIDIETQSVFKALDKKPEFMGCNYAAHSARHNGDLFMDSVANTTLGQETWKV